MNAVELLSKYEEPVVTLALSARGLLLSVLPGIAEEVDLSANVIGYGYGKGYKDTICAMILSKKGIKLGFYRASELPDPAGLLEGSGKVHKYVAITKLSEIERPELLQLVHSALNRYREQYAGS